MMGAATRASLARAVRKPKYRNHRVTIAGVTYDSKREAENHLKLQVLERTGVIRNLRHHVRYPIIVAGVRVCTWTADHVWEDQQGKEVVADTKSPVTRKEPRYRLKRKLFEALYKTPIVEL